MATRLISAGHKLIVFDASPASLNQIASKGARVVNSAKEVGDSVETVFLSLPTPAIVKEVCLTPETGLINGTKVKRVVDCSTTGSKTATDVGEALAANGIQLVGLLKPL
jgi:2-hydroxy-3-oxopropionate reductase